MNTESRKLFTCDVCETTFTSAGRLSRHKDISGIHDAVRRNSNNEIVYACNLCDKDYISPKGLNNHQRYSKHADAPLLSEPTKEHVAVDTDVYVADEILRPVEDGRIRNEISHQTERVIELSTSLAMGNVQEAVKRALRSVREEMIPLYAAASVDRADAWERVCKILAPFEDGLIMTVLRDTFDLATALKADVECLERAPPIVWSVTR